MALLARCHQLTSSLTRSWCRRLSLGPEVLRFSDEVQQARLQAGPLVALESTIITHGMPYPQNLETAMEVEKIIRKQGATPATIAILKGQVTVGLSTQQLAVLARSTDAVKTSRRDLAHVLASGLDGATTVAGTIVVAELAGIPIFATGGLGGVHRGGQHTLDVSADLTELGRSSTCVVCSGVKSILDIPRTLEYLETQGVLVAAYGNSRAFPAFYTRRSGHEAPYRLQDAAQAARTLRAAHKLKLRSGMVVAVPVPERSAMGESEMESAIEGALQAASAAGGVRGKQITPFLLAAVAEATKGRSLATNIALIKNNAKVGADIAVEFSKLKSHSNDSAKCIGRAGGGEGGGDGSSKVISRTYHTSSASYRQYDGKASEIKDEHGVDEAEERKKPRTGPLIIGGANLDRTYRLIDSEMKGSLPIRCGGIAVRRVEDVGVPAFLASAFGATELVTAILPLTSDEPVTVICFLDEALNVWKSLCPDEDLPFAKAKQKAWDLPVVKALHDAIQESISPVQLARLKAISTPESGCWLNAVPSPQIGTLLDNNTIRISIALQLGCDVCQPHIIMCL